MPASLKYSGLRAPADLMSRLLDGTSWTARRIHPNNLRQQCRSIARLFQRRNPLTDHLAPICQPLFVLLAERSSLLTQCHPVEWDAATVILRLAYYSYAWRRMPETWVNDATADARSQWAGLIRHLLNDYPVPDYFYSAWLTFGDIKHLERDWYCHLAQGGNLRQAPGMPSFIPARALHLALAAAGHFTVRQAIRLGQLEALTAGAGLRAEVLESRMVHDFSNEAIWSRLLPKMAAERSWVAGRFGLISDTLAVVREREGWARAQQLLSLPLPDLNRYCTKFWQEIGAMVAGQGMEIEEARLTDSGYRMGMLKRITQQWSALDGTRDMTLTDGMGREAMVWTFRELTNGTALIQESRRLRHCVSTYRRKCEGGESAIFSIEAHHPEESGNPPAPRLTMEVIRSCRRLVQIRGKWNRGVEDRELKMIAKWAEQNQVRLAES